MKTLLASCALVLLLLLPMSATADPALWVIKDANTTIYLFGTVHLLPNDSSWRSATLDKALADSRILYIEVTDDDPGNMTALVLQHGMDAAHPLNTQLSSSEMLRLVNAANRAGVPGGAQMLNLMRPWLAALTIATAPLLKAGLDPAQGVDKQLKAQMVAAAKPVLGLETAEQQIRLLADMPQSVQLALLRSSLRDFDNASTELTKLIDAWKAGDVATIARLEDEDLRQKDPMLYERLLVQRNQRWAATIGDLLTHEHGTLFVAVGAAHLAGPDSVQAQLRKLGVETERE
jgi:uncharacterized protein YbaP (TraB family)